jgi:hypothetical protein
MGLEFSQISLDPLAVGFYPFFKDALKLKRAVLKPHEGLQQLF